MKKNIYVIILLIVLGIFDQAQAQDNFQIKNTSNNILLEVKDEGVLIAKMTHTTRIGNAANLSSSDNGLFVYDTDENSFYMWKNPNWVKMDVKNLIEDADADTKIQVEGKSR